MQIFIKTLHGAVFDIEIPVFSTIGEIKLLIEELQWIPPAKQSLLFAGKQLLDGRTISDFLIIYKEKNKVFVSTEVTPYL